MAIHVICPGCHARFKVGDKHAGKKGPCPKCKAEIQVPRKEDEVIIKAPEQFGGARDASGNLVLKPIERKETTLTPVKIVTIVGSIIMIFVATFGIRAYYPDGDIPRLITAVGALLLAPPLAFVGYSFLRESELEPYRGLSLILRVAICAAVYALLWGIYPLAARYFFGDGTLEVWNLAFLVPPFLILGALTAFASLDLNPTIAFFHYAFYLAVTVLFRLTIGLSAY